MTRARTTPWKPELWSRAYRGKYVSVEHAWRNDVLGWAWWTMGKTGHARALAAAQRAAERAVDAALDGEKKR